MNGFLVKGGLVLAIGAGVFLVSSGVNLGAKKAYDQAAPEGVLMPQASAKPRSERRAPAEREKVRKRVRFTLDTDQALDKNSFESLTDGVNVRLISATPVKESRKTQSTVPRSIVLLLDNSFSMNQVTPPSMGGGQQLPMSDPEYKRLDASRLLLESVGERDRIALASFPCRNPFPGRLNYVLMDPEVVTPFGPARNALSDLETLRGAENSGTPLYRGIDLALSVLESEDASRNKIIIALTDGRDTEHMDSVPEGLRKAVQDSGAKLFVVTLGSTPDLASLNKIADEVIAAADSNQLSDAFLQIAEQLEEVVVGYTVDMVLDVPDRAAVNSGEATIQYRAGNRQFNTTVPIPEGDDK